MNSRRRQTGERGTGGAPLSERRAEVQRTTTVERLETSPRVPHIGWNDLDWGPAGAGVTRGLPAPATVYFVRSCAALPANPAVVTATTESGSPVVAALARDDVRAVQFHPEKSSRSALSILRDFGSGAGEGAR